MDDKTAINYAIAAIGALISNSYLEPTTRISAFTNIAIGTAFAAITAPAVIDIVRWQFPTLPITSSIIGASNFLLGLFAMVIIPAIVRIIKSLKAPAQDNQDGNGN